MINVSDNVNQVLGRWGRFEKQAPFAIALALTRTAQDAVKPMGAAVDRASEGGAVAYTRSAFYAEPARKDRLQSHVAIKTRQSQYLRWLIDGGTRPPKRVAQRLPAVVSLTPQGNLPAGAIAKLVQRAKAGKRATRAQAKRFGVSSELDLFYGDPKDERPAGVYKRVVHADGRHQLIPVVVFPRIAARYTDPAFKFHELAAARARQVFPDHLRRAIAQARATAR